MRIAISGHTGFIGTELKNYFKSKNYEIIGIGRSDFEAEASVLAEKLDGVDFIINLAGAPIIKRWTRSYSRKLWNSRIDTTKKIIHALTYCKKLPKAFFSTSAVHIYDDHHIHTEESEHLDSNFLGTLCSAWEEEAMKAQRFMPVYLLRTGIILGNNGGALPQMSMPFRLFAGGKIGSGKQMISWMHIQDYQEAIHYLMDKLPDTHIFNFTSPEPLSNAAFSAKLAQKLNRPNWLKVPAFALKLIFGEGAVVLLTGPNVLPSALQKAGYRFRFSKLENALDDLLS